MKSLTALQDANVKFLLFKKMNQKNISWKLGEHKHDFFQILYFYNGNVTTNIQEQSVKISLYDAILYPKNVYHKLKPDFTKHQESMCINFIIDKPDLLNEVVHVKDSHGKIGMFFENIQEEYNKELPYSDELINYYTKMILYHIFREVEFKKNSKHQHMNLIINYIKHNYKKEIRISELCSVGNISEGHLIRTFKKEMNMPPIQYVNKLRIEEAKHLLITTDLLVKEVSYMIGFHNEKYFSKIFKNVVGIGAKDFKKI